MRRKLAVSTRVVAVALSLAMAMPLAMSFATPADALALPGQELKSAQKEDFFTFFHLQERAMDERDDMVTHYFRPKSRNDLIVSIDTNKEGKILQMGLIVSRAFVDDPSTNIFARDIVKSFIEVATPSANSAETETIVKEIFLRGTKLTETSVETVRFNGKDDKLVEDGSLQKVGSGELKEGDVAIIMKGKMPKLPEQPSDAFRAFEGVIDDVDLPLNGAHLIIRNHETPKGRLLEVRVDVDAVKKFPKLE